MTPRRRRLLIVLAAFGLTAMIAALLASRAEEWLRGEIERRLQDRLGPAVSLAGPLSFSVLPRPALVVRDVLLGDGERVLAIDRLVLEIAPASLSADALSIASLRVEGVSARLVRDAGGQWNAATWLRPAPGGGAAPALRVERFAVIDVELRLDDAVTGVSGELSVPRLEAGPLAVGETATVSLSGRLVLAEPRPVTGELRLAGRVTAAPAGLTLSGLEATAAGASGEWVLESAELAVDRATSTPGNGMRGEGMRAVLRVAGSAGQGVVHLAIAAAARGDDGWQGEGLVLTVDAEGGDASFNGQLTAPDLALHGAEWRVPAGALRLSAALADERRIGAQVPLDAQGDGLAGSVRFGPASISVPHPAGGKRALEVTADGALRFTAGRMVGQLAGAFDRSRFAGSWRYRPGAEIPAELTLTVDRLDADRYLPPEAARPEQPALDAWVDWPLRGEARIGMLHYRGIDARNIRLKMNGGVGEGFERAQME